MTTYKYEYMQICTNNGKLLDSFAPLRFAQNYVLKMEICPLRYAAVEMT